MARLQCQNGISLQFSIDPMTLLKLQYSKACAEHLTGIELSNAVIVRAAIQRYTDHLEQLLGLPPEDLQRDSLLYWLRTAAAAHTRPPDKLLVNLPQEPFPKLSELLKRDQAGSRERIWKELKNTWFYVHSFKKPGQQTK